MVVEIDDDDEQMIAMIRIGAPDPPAIFIGNPMTVAPVGGSRCKSLTFSKSGILPPRRI
jgi:hypothetical protein